ncbi:MULTISPECIES: hypothetical protein [Micromonospora]|uniref:hypothetical protein n=1 Tax=Micromonospora TaxID=1873 RepID=UPI001EE906B1|nr:hypothetical protein [Micromonospora foliorum]MCG5437485.1 hypothetical protein [Micromonospora foliorum]
MESGSLIRLLCLVIAVLSGGLTATITSWISWAIEPSIGQALLSGGVAFGGCCALVLTAIRFLSGRDA